MQSGLCSILYGHVFETLIVAYSLQGRMSLPWSLPTGVTQYSTIHWSQPPMVMVFECLTLPMLQPCKERLAGEQYNVLARSINNVPAQTVAIIKHGHMYYSQWNIDKELRISVKLFFFYGWTTYTSIHNAHGYTCREMECAYSSRRSHGQDYKYTSKKKCTTC